MYRFIRPVAVKIGVFMARGTSTHHGIHKLQRMLLGAVLAAVTVAASSAATVYRVFTNDNFAYATYYQYNVDGCTQLAVEVFASQSMTRTNDYRFFYPLVRAQLSSYNFCTGVFSFMSGADEAPQLISIKNDLTSATTTSTVVMFDEFGASRTIQINLTWSGGELSTDKNKYVTTSPYTRTMVKSTASIRNSTSITGALVLDGLNLLGPDNPTLGSGIFGFVVSDGGTTIDITRYR